MNKNIALRFLQISFVATRKAFCETIRKQYWQWCVTFENNWKTLVITRHYWPSIDSKTEQLIFPFTIQGIKRVPIKLSPLTAVAYFSTKQHIIYSPRIQTNDSYNRSIKHQILLLHTPSPTPKSYSFGSTTSLEQNQMQRNLCSLIQ